MITANRRALLITLTLALLAGLLGAFAGTRLGSAAPDHGGGLHALVHEELDLSAAQEQTIAAEEKSFARRRLEVDRGLRRANAALAQAIRTTKRDGPEVQSAVDRVHRAMGDYQKETIAHIFRMRSVLTPEQADTFDRAVADALTKDGH